MGGRGFGKGGGDGPEQGLLFVPRKKRIPKAIEHHFAQFVPVHTALLMYTPQLVGNRRAAEETIVGVDRYGDARFDVAPERVRLEARHDVGLHIARGADFEWDLMIHAALLATRAWTFLPAANPQDVDVTLDCQTAADDVELITDECRLATYTVAVRGMSRSMLISPKMIPFLPSVVIGKSRLRTSHFPSRRI